MPIAWKLQNDKAVLFITPICELITELGLITDFELVTKFWEVPIEHWNGCASQRLLFRTPGPVQYGTCVCSNVETILPWACRDLELWISNIPRYFVLPSTSISSICPNTLIVSSSEYLVLDSLREFLHKQNRSTEGCSKLKRSVDMTSSGKNGLNIRTNASPKWDRTRCPEE